MIDTGDLPKNIEDQSVIIEKPHDKTRSSILDNSRTASQRYPPQTIHVFQELWLYLVV